MSEENKTADTILQKPYEVEAGGKTYTIARPTLATLIEVSKYISGMPKMEDMQKGDILPFVLSHAKDCGEAFGRIAATLIIGAANISEPNRKSVKPKLLGFIRKSKKGNSNVDKLSRELTLNASMEEIFNIISAGLSYQKIGFFLNSIIFLSGANVLEKTKSETEVTASGD